MRIKITWDRVDNEIYPSFHIKRRFLGLYFNMLHPVLKDLGDATKWVKTWAAAHNVSWLCVYVDAPINVIVAQTNKE